MKTPQEILLYIQSKKKADSTFLLGIDGPGGSGKTTLAEALKKLEKTIQIVHMDDFDLPSNGKIMGNPLHKEIGEDTDWKRLKKEVLLPLRDNKKTSFYPFDREGERFGRKQQVFPNGIVIVEGVFAIRKELLPFYDYTLWLTSDKKSRLKRVIKRDGEKMRERWEKDWLPMEERYRTSHKPHKYAHEKVDTDLLFRDLFI